MRASSFAVFGVSPLITGAELEKFLLEYKIQLVRLHTLYAANFARLQNVAIRMINGQTVENILARRYTLGFDFDKTLLSEDELNKMDSFDDNIMQDTQGDAKNSLNSSSQAKYKAGESLPKKGDTKSKKEEFSELYTLSGMEIASIIKKIDTAKDEYSKDTHSPKDISKMLDVFLEIKYKDKIREIAKSLNEAMKASGKKYTDEDFRLALVTSTPYTQLAEYYDQINTQDKRNMLIPEYYVTSHMSDLSEYKIMPYERINQLLKREKAYEAEHISNRIAAYIDPKKIDELEMAENQNHDYSWGMVLQRPQYIMRDEPVNTPIFKGHITVERLGAFTEESLFKKKKFGYETRQNIAQRSDTKQTSISKRLRLKQSRQDNSKNRHMRDYFYKYEATKTLSDDVLRVTKVDTNGIATTRIIIAPLQYTGIEGPEYLEFLKNIYFSDYMLDMAARNGGFAGRVAYNADGYYISNRYNQDEISSAILFVNGAKGNILDVRGMEKKIYSNATIDTFKSLLNRKERDRNFYE